MSELPDAFLAAWNERAGGTSMEALAVFLTLITMAPASPAMLAKRLGLPQANILRALAELSAPTIALVAFSQESGKAGRRTVSFSESADALQSLLNNQTS